MSAMDDSAVGLRLYWVAATGLEDKASVVVAADEDEAIRKALHYPDIHDAVVEGSSVRAWDLTTHFESKGYQIIISEKGLFH